MMNRAINHSFRILLVLLAGVVLMSCDANQTDDDSSPVDGQHSFAGETITVVIGLDASAGGTTVGRLLAKHLELNLAGNPTVIVNNMPGASALNAHLHVLRKAPKDGTTLYYGPRSSLGELLNPGGTEMRCDIFLRARKFDAALRHRAKRHGGPRYENKA